MGRCASRAGAQVRLEPVARRRDVEPIFEPGSTNRIGEACHTFARSRSLSLIAAPSPHNQPSPEPWIRANIDRSYGACRDFFMFANNGWIFRRIRFPTAFSGWGKFNELSERNTLVLKGIVERAAAEAGIVRPIRGRRKLGTFYATCMDSAAAEREGVRPSPRAHAHHRSITARTFATRSRACTRGIQRRVLSMAPGPTPGRART